MKKWLIGFLLMCSASTQANECVILLHGLARTDASMKKLEVALVHEGYFVVNHPYPSRQKNIQALAEEEIPVAIAQCLSAKTINFVTHSLGGILLRQYLSTHTVSNLGRAVMLGPPNKGSQVVDKLKTVPGYQFINGPAGMQLGTDSESVPILLGKANFEVGIIAGTKSINLILSTMLPNPNDGKVSVENTKLDGMTDHITVPVSHPFMMRNTQVTDNIFLKKW